MTPISRPPGSIPLVRPKRKQVLLRVGDVVESSIRTDDGKIDLGVQRNEVVNA